MGEQIINTKNEAVDRWQQQMPPFFRKIVKACACIIITAFTVNTIMVNGGAEPHQWWCDVYPLLLAVPAGMITICKLTVAGGYKHINIDKLSRGQMPQSSHSCNMSDVDAVSPGPVESEPADIEPVHFSDLDDANVEH